MGVFSSVKDLLNSGKKEFVSSHQNHMKNVEKSGIKVIELKRKGTETTIVRLSVEDNYKLEEYAKSIANHPSISKGSILDKL